MICGGNPRISAEVPPTRTNIYQQRLLLGLLYPYSVDMDEAEGYENWLNAQHAAAARRYATELQGDMPNLAKLLDNLAAIAERSAS